MIIKCLRVSLIALGVVALSGVAFANNGFGVAGESNTQASDALQAARAAALKVPAREAGITRLMHDSGAVFVGNLSNSNHTNYIDSKKTQAVQATDKALNKPAIDQDRQALGATNVSQQAFADMVRNMMPLSPTQIHTLRYLFNQSQKAAAEYPGIPPRPTITSLKVNLAPGATPPVVRLREGYVTPLVFVDSTGAPWPITAIDVGNPKAFSVAWNGKGNTVVVQAKDAYDAGNMVVFLKGKDIPVVVTLMPGQRAVDYRVNLRVAGLGPNAQPDISGLPTAASEQLITFLNGIPAKGAHPLTILGGGLNTQAWLYQGHIILRTQLAVLSPGWVASMSSPGGTHVYELPKTPDILASYLGQVEQLSVKGL